MDGERWTRVKEVFSSVVDLDAAGRECLLDDLCGTDDELRREVLALLASNDEVEDFIEQPAFAAPGALESEIDLSSNRRLGPYRIVREIGRGGMGTVFLARRDDGEFQQEAAIKVVSSAFLGKESLRRFRLERQILAGLNHPNIARLLDGGVTDDGLPFLVMEFVDGRPLLDHAEANNLTIAARLGLFMKVCEAVAYAHRNLVVHRDLKPSNVLITPAGEPKLLDFGLAKMLDLDKDAEQTKSHFRALTPAYASPEHLRGERVTTASDIYSLGVMLYELLTGLRPYEPDPLTIEKIASRVSVPEPVRPSSRLSAQGAYQSAPLISQLRGDIDNIVLTAMRVEPERRYQSADKLGEDIDRHLRGLPISASEPTLAYRASKFIQRNRIAAALSAILVLILTAGAAATLWQSREARRERDKAMRVTAFLQNILGSVAPEQKGANVTMREALDEASSRARVEFAGSPEVLADVLMTTGRTYTSLTVNDRGEKDLREAFELSRQANGDAHETTLGSIAMLGIALAFENKSEEGEKISLQAVELNRRYGKPGSENLGIALYANAVNLIQRGNAAAALPLAVEAAETIRASLGEQHGYYLATRNVAALAHQTLGNSQEAERIFREVIDRGRGIDSRFRIYVAQASSLLAWTLIDSRRLEEAEVHASEALRLYTDVLGSSNPSTAISNLQLGIVLLERKEFERAEPQLRTALEFFEKDPASGPQYSNMARLRLGTTLNELGRPVDAEPLLRKAVDISAATLLPASSRYYEIRFPLVRCLLRQGRRGEARQILTEMETAAAGAPSLSPSVPEGIKELRAQAR
jgi:serine/threonine-protein kinase